MKKTTILLLLVVICSTACTKQDNVIETNQLDTIQTEENIDLITTEEVTESLNVEVSTEEVFQPIFEANSLTVEDIEYMTGKSYDPENSIASDDLSMLTISYIDFNDMPQTGKMVVNKDVADEVLDIFRELYVARFPIERINLVDEYNADDETSMRDNNTSAYNHRFINGTTKLSNHAKGLAIDINPLVNPYVKGTFIQPETAGEYVDRTVAYKGIIEKNSVCYNAFVSRGWEWGGDWKSGKDYQHFEKTKPVSEINK